MSIRFPCFFPLPPQNLNCTFLEIMNNAVLLFFKVDLKEFLQPNMSTLSLGFYHCSLSTELHWKTDNLMCQMCRPTGHTVLISNVK